jgi:hypothetical protein
MATNLWNERLIGSEDANTYLADQWLSYISIMTSAGDTASFSSQLSELHKIFDELNAISESYPETHPFSE